MFYVYDPTRRYDAFIFAFANNQLQFIATSCRILRIKKRPVSKPFLFVLFIGGGDYSLYQ